MRKITPLVILSLTAPMLATADAAHATTDNAPSSYVIDLLHDSKIVDKEIDTIESPEEFEIESAARSNTPQERLVSSTSSTELEEKKDAETEVEDVQGEGDNLEEDIDSEESELEENPDNDSVEESPQPEEENIPDSEETPTEQETSEATDTYTLLTDPLETEGFHVAGVTWEGAAPEQVDVRAYSDDEWTEWFSLEIDVVGEGTDGTEPIMAAGSHGIQVRASGEVLPESFNVHLMTGEGNTGNEHESQPNEAEEQPTPGTELEPAENVSATPAREDQNFLLSNATSNDAPAAELATARQATNLKTVPFSKNIVSRTQWGAPRNATWQTRYASLQGAIVHHTDGSNSYTRAQAPNIVKGIWNFHTYTRGWGDIGYNFLIDKYGTVYEGRSGSVAAKPGQMAIGAHAAPANTGSVGVSVLGSYTGGVNPSSTVLDTISEVIAWQFAMADVNPKGKFTYRSGSSNKTTNAISGHRDISATACPGNIYSRLGTIRNSVASKMSKYDVDRDPVFERVESSGKGWPHTDAWSMGDFSGNGTTDLMLRNSSGRIVLYKGRGDNSFSDGIQIGRGWNGFTDLYTGVDFDGDSNPDILAINSSNQLFLYPGNGRGQLKDGRQIGRGWGFKHLIVLEDGPGGNPAIAGITTNGALTIYTTNGRGGFVDSTQIGNGYSNLIGAVAVGDWDRSGFSDVVTVNPSGRLHYFSDPTKNGFKNSVQIGRGWGGLTLLPGDSTGGYHDIHTVSRNGRLSTYIFSR